MVEYFALLPNEMILTSSKFGALLNELLANLAVTLEGGGFEIVRSEDGLGIELASELGNQINWISVANNEG